MSLLGDIAAALSEGIGGGMIANAQWGIEEDKQAKKEAADNARLQEQLKLDDARTQAYKDSDAARLEDNKADRAARAEEARLNRESNERIAAMQRRGAGGGRSRGDAIDDLKMLDLTIRGFDKERADLIADLENETDPGKRAAIQAQINDITQRRGALINGPAAKQIAAMNGEIGAAYLSQYFEPKQEQAPAQQVPDSPIKPPPRAGETSNWSGGSPQGGGLISKMQATESSTPPTEDSGSHWFQADPSKTPTLSSVGQRLMNGQPSAPERDWNSLKGPQSGGWEAPLRKVPAPAVPGQRDGGYKYEWNW